MDKEFVTVEIPSEIIERALRSRDNQTGTPSIANFIIAHVRAAAAWNKKKELENSIYALAKSLGRSAIEVENEALESFIKQHRQVKCRATLTKVENSEDETAEK